MDYGVRLLPFLAMQFQADRCPFSNDSMESDMLHQLYFDAFEGTSDSLRMATVSPQIVDGQKANWYGAGGSSILGASHIPTIG